MKKSSAWLVSFLSVVLAALIWSTSFVATKLALSDISPFVLGFLRLIIATFCLGALMFATGSAKIPKFPDLLRMGISGLSGLTLYFCFENYGLKLSSASDGALLIGSFPVLTMVMGYFFLGERLSPKRLLGSAVAIFGIYLIIQNAAFVSGPRRLTGDIFLVLSGVTWAIYNFVTRGIVGRYPMLTVNFYQNLAGTLCFIPFVLMESSRSVVFHGTSLHALLYLGFICSIVAYLLYNYGLRQMDSSSAVSVMNLIPVFGVFFSWLILNERTTLLQLAGGVIVLAGVSMSLQKGKSAKS